MTPNDRRWVLLSKIAPAVGVSTRALRYWCAGQRVPACKRGGGRWWVDVRKLRGQIVRRGEDTHLADITTDLVRSLV